MARRRPAPPPRLHPWPVVVLAIDPGLTSGWALWAQGRHAGSGEAQVLDVEAVARVVRGALEIAEVASMPAVLVLERAYTGRTRHMGPARPLWERVWADQGGVKGRVVRVYPATWRAKVLGRGMGSAKRAVAREAEQAVARRLARRRVGPDEAPAVCIGRWAVLAGELERVLPKSVVEAA
ncbi:MAG: hypothetical protein GWN84_20835 [Gammaproteobacteria bacterium]|nr:hypothetical protein [Gammaproteobacteria bacterium]NIR85207.1 hypothetical protein [Gammaproteobacteria bacterium]NIU06257.1 hypothetical protein [Gammaproteobacteria bacterium]NIX87530.1 hypothetical protein [Gammaproteobacteria bacterium]